MKLTRWQRQFDVRQLVFGRVYQNAALGAKSATYDCLVAHDDVSVFGCACDQESDADISSEVDMMMSSDIVVASLSTKHVTFNRLRSGWLFREDRTVLLLSLFVKITAPLHHRSVSLSASASFLGRVTVA